jgi:ABC-type Fe3+/spermidine/putrescine transport system ATPase subunit
VAEFVGAANIVEGRSRGGGVFDTIAGMLTKVDQSVPSGDTVKLSWRPEDMHVAAPGVRPDIAGARVVSTVFHGNLIELVVDAGGQLLRVQIANDAAMTVGEVVDFTISPGRVRVVN